MPTVLELRKKASELSIPGRSQMKKAELEAVIRKYEGRSPRQPSKKPIAKSVKRASRKPSIKSLCISIAQIKDNRMELSTSFITTLSAIINAFIKKLPKNPRVSDVEKLLDNKEGDEGTFLRDAMVQFINRENLRSFREYIEVVDKTTEYFGSVLSVISYLLIEIIVLSVNNARDKNMVKVLPKNLFEVINDDYDLKFLVCRIKPVKGIRC